MSALLGRAREAGALVEVAEMPSPAGLAAFDRELLVRVLREGLTNALKHAPGEPVGIRAAVEGSALRVTIRNAASVPRTAGARTGTGLAALAARLEQTGGRLDAARDGPEFVLDAVIPPQGAEPEEEAEPVDSETFETAVLAGARRRGRTILAAAVVLVAVLLGAAEAASVFQAHRALLPARDFARIEPGATRAEAGALLPNHELLPAPASPPGTDCHDYAVTSDPLDDAAGDVHRVCFTGGVVASARLVLSAER